MQKKILLILFVLCLASCCYGTDWYVRPEGGDYGGEDGSDYDNAWDGLLEVVWGGGGVVAGDTLYVCGLHIHDMVGLGGGLTTNGDITLVSGSSGNRITIRGDYSEEAGVVWGAYIPTLFGSWVDETGCYSLDVTGSHSSVWSFEDVTIDSWVVLDKKSSVQNVKDNAGSFYWDSGDTKLYVRCTDSGNPTGRILITDYGYDWKLNGRQYITFLNLKFYNPYPFLWEVWESGSHIKWEGCTLTYGKHSLITLRNDCHYIEIVDCELSWAQNGIYTLSDDNNAPSNYTFSGNYIHDIGSIPRIYHGDSHAIGIQGGHDGLIEKNYIVNAGNALLLYTAQNQELTNTIVRYNYVKDTHSLGGAGGYGIALQTDQRCISDRTGNEIYGNIVENASIGYRTSFTRDLVKLYNNLAIASRDTSFSFLGSSDVIDFDGGTTEFAKEDVVTQVGGVSATVKDVSQQTGSSPNISGTISLDDIVGVFVNDVILTVGEVNYAIADGTTYELASNIEMRNSISFNPSSLHISWNDDEAPAASLVSEYNLFWPNDGNRFDEVYGGSPVNFAGWQGKSWDVTGSAIGDPKFISVGGSNFKLLSDSPAIDTGVDVGLTEDYIGTSIPQNGVPDIGVYEYISGIRYLVANLF